VPCLDGGKIVENGLRFQEREARRRREDDIGVGEEVEAFERILDIAIGLGGACAELDAAFDEDFAVR
jgi:hypothetical protein